MTVVIRGDRIVRVTPSKSVALTADTVVIDGTSKVVIPGLWDLHMHVIETADIYFPALLAYGVTGIRNMHNTSLQEGARLRADVETGKAVGPYIVLSGPLVDGAAYWPTAIKVSSSAEARRAVDVLKAGGADFIKVYTFLSRDAYFAIVDEARRQHISFVGHVPQTVSVSEASAAGQRSIEHLDRVLLDSSSLGEKSDQRFNDAMTLWSNPATEAAGQTAMIGAKKATIESYDPARAGRLFRKFVRNGTWQTPTLVAHYTAAFRGEPEIRDNTTLAFVPLPQLNQWRAIPAPPEEWTQSQRSLLRKNMELLGAMKRAGVRILAGTDVGNAWLVPGDSLHRELALLVEAGLTPMEALQSATRDAADFLGRSKVFGTLEKGKVADIIILDANPLDDIHNTRKIHAVVTRGWYLGRDELDRMLANAAHAATLGQN
jgi:hypothetical protein